MAATSGTTFGLTESDRILPIVPMFHANAWGLPYAGWMTGSDFVMPNRFLQGEPLCKLIMAEKPTVSGAVRTVWNYILAYATRTRQPRSTSLRLVPARLRRPPSLIEAFEPRHGCGSSMPGLTETSPLAAFPRRQERPGSTHGVAGQDRPARRRGAAHQADYGSVLPWTSAVGEIEVRGPVTAPTTGRRPRSSTAAGCGRVTSAASSPTASSRSPTGPRTSSSPAASGSPPSSSRGR